MSGVLKMRGGAPCWKQCEASAGPRRLAVIAMSGTAIVALVVVVALSGHRAVPVSQDARMKPVDPLPGGLHSTPEMNALGFEADTQQAFRPRSSGEPDTTGPGAQRADVSVATRARPDDAGPHASTRTPAVASAACRGAGACGHAPGSRRDAHADRRTRAGHSRAGRGRSEGSRSHQQADRRPVQPMGRPASEDRNGSSAFGAGGRPQRSGPERHCGHSNHGALSTCSDAGIAAVGRADRSCARSSGTRRIRSPHSGAEFGSVEPCRHAGR